ncbi:MAG: FkbM family methyltransferase [Bacteroidota bacterium]
MEISHKTARLNQLRSIFTYKPLENILVNFTKGKYFGELITKFPPNHYQYNQQTIRKVNRNGIQFELDLSDIVDWYIYWGFKDKAREALYSFIKAGYTVIDVGANVGEVSLTASQLVGPKGNIISFEPDPVNFQRFMKNFNINSPKNVRVNQMGLGDQEGHFLLQTIDVNNKGKNKIIPNSFNHSSEEEFSKRVKIVTMDDFVKSHEISNIDLIKIDVEGYENKVLSGAIESLKSFKPILFIEIDETLLTAQNSHPSKIIHLLHQLGYSCFIADTKEKIDENYDFHKCHFDVYALPS